MRWRNQKIFVGKVLSGAYIGLQPLDEDEWKVWFFEHPLGIFDERRGIIRKLNIKPETTATQPEEACGSKEV